MIIKLKKTLDVVIQIFIDQNFTEEKQKRIKLKNYFILLEIL